MKLHDRAMIDGGMACGKKKEGGFW